MSHHRAMDSRKKLIATRLFTSRGNSEARLAAVLVGILCLSVCLPLLAASKTLTFSERPYVETPLPVDYGSDEEISLAWSTYGQSSLRVTSTGESPFSDHSPDGTNRFIFAQGTSVIKFNPTVRLVRVFVRDNEPDFLANSVSGIVVGGQLADVPVFSVTVDFVPSHHSGLWIEVNGQGAIDTLLLISLDGGSKSYLVDDLEIEVYSETEVIALAGRNQSVLEGSVVTLDGNGSLNATSFSWAQVLVGEEPEVLLSSPNEAVTTFVSPDVVTAKTLTFELTASGPLGSDTDRVEVAVQLSTAPTTAPKGVVALPNEREGCLQAVIEWSSHPDAVRYTVYRAEGDPDNDYAKVAPSIGETSYEDSWLEEGVIYFYKVAAVNDFGTGPASDAVGFVASRNLALDYDAVPIARILNPTGTGLRDIEAMRDGVTDESYDSYHGGVKEAEDWYGYFWYLPRYFDAIIYYEGENFFDGGWWTSLTVEYTPDGEHWEKAGDLKIRPPYPFNDVRTGRVAFSRFQLTFERCQGIGIRIRGAPGGMADFTSVAELEVYGDQEENIVVANAGADLEGEEGSQIVLHGEGSLNAEQYFWEQIRVGDEPEVVLADFDTPNPSFVVKDVSRNTVLTFRLTVTGLHGPKSDTVNVTVANREPPKPTEGLIAIGGDRKVELSWQPNGDATTYTLLRDSVPGGGGTVVAEDIPGTSYLDGDSSLKVYHRYYYQVVGVNEHGEGPGSNVASATPIENFAMYADALPIARVTQPTGSGQKDLEVIRNGVFEEKGYDSYDGPNPATEDWYGYLWSDPIYPDRIEYTMGRNYLDGGWWTHLTVEYTTDGVSWLEAPGVTITPAYVFDDNPTGRPDYSHYTLEFGRVRALGLRIAGTPGGFAQFTSIVELEVYGLDAVLACRRDVLPLFYTPGRTVRVSLAVEVHEPPPPELLSVTELIPPEATLVDPGGGSTAIPGEITWSFGPGEVEERELIYAVGIPPDFTGKLLFAGTLSYGGISEQRIRGEDSLYPEPAAPVNLRLEMTLWGHLKWSPVLGEGVVGYHVYRSVNGQEYEDISGAMGQTFFDDADVETGAAYRYKVTMENALGIESSLAATTGVGPAFVTMLRREFEDYNFGGGLFPGEEGKAGLKAWDSEDLSANADFFYHDASASNSYRPADAVAIEDFATGGHFLKEVTKGDWWRFSFDLESEGYVKIADLRVASNEEATYDFFWDEQPVGRFSFNTGDEAQWRTYEMDVPAFFSAAGVHTLRVLGVSGESNVDSLGIGFDWAPPTRQTIFADDFDAYATTSEVVDDGGWIIVNGSGEAEGAWRLWSTDGQPLSEGEVGPDFPGFSSGYMVSNGDFAGNVELDEELISPEIDCVGYSCVAVEFFGAINIYEQDAEGDLQTTDFEMTVYDETENRWSDWVNFYTHDRTGGDDFTAIPKRFDASSLADGKRVRFRWRFHNTRYDYWWAIDKAKVTGEKCPPRVTSAAVSQGGVIYLSWEGGSGSSYTVEYTDDLIGGFWQPVPGTEWPIAETSWQGDDVSQERGRFYRVVSQ